MRSVFRVLKIRSFALLLYVLDCKTILFCFTYVIYTVFLTLILQSFVFDLAEFPWRDILLLLGMCMAFILVSYWVLRAVYKIETSWKTLLAALLVSTVFSSVALCGFRKKIEKVQSFIGSEAEITATVVSLEGKNRSVVKSPDSHLGLTLTEEYSKSVLHVGDSCTFEGTFVEPRSFEDFDYKEYLYRKGIYSIFKVKKVECKASTPSLLSIRSKLEKAIETSMPEPESSLLVGILLGSKREFSGRFDSAVKAAGVSHVISASGYNVSILILAVEKLFKLLDHKSRVVTQLISIWLYTLMAGIPASLLRASVMTSIYLLSVFTGRSSSKHISILLCITILVMFNPFLIFDIGFLLSLFSTIGLIYFLSAIDSERIPSVLRNYLLPTVSCTLFTLPITVSIFGKMSVTSILVNFLLLPVIESTMIFGILSVIIYRVFPSLNIIFVVPYLQLLVFKKVVELFSHIEMVAVVIDPVVLILVFYLFLLVFCIVKYPVRNEKHNYYFKQASRILSL